MRPIFLLALSIMVFTSCNNSEKKKPDETVTTAEVEKPQPIKEHSDQDFVNITPIEHATMVLQWDNVVLYVDPVGGSKAFNGQPEPNIVLVTDIHGDHLNVETLKAVMKDSTILIAPQAVADKLPDPLKEKTQVIKNGESTIHNNIAIEAMPMYNLREEAKKFHEKGRGNGYILEKEGNRLYISGDTEDISEMRNLNDIDIAIVCMNLPYTMPVNKAAEAVLDFKPHIVYPYHYRGQNGLSDVSKFKEMVNNQDESITVKQLDWYPD